MNQPTEAQKFTRERNFNKMRLKGILHNLYCFSKQKDKFAFDERLLFQRAYKDIEQVLSKWDGSTNEIRQEFGIKNKEN